MLVSGEQGNTNNNALQINADLTKPATVLIERISDAIGALFKPRQIVRNAVAQSRAAIIQAEARVKVTEIEEQGLRRLIYEEGKNQANIEQIVAKALPLVTCDARPEDIEADLITHIFDRCRNISDSDMQAIWSRLLAGEANQPGSFSKRTVDLVASLDKADALLFERLSRYAWNIGIMFLERPDLATIEVGLTYQELAHLESLSLIRYEDAGFHTTIESPDAELALEYFNRLVVCASDSPPQIVQVGRVMLTKSGEQLLKLCKCVPSHAIFDEVVRHLVNQNLRVFSPT